MNKPSSLINLRIDIVQKLIDINERIIFYPKLRRFYLRLLQSATPLILDVGCNKGQSIDFFLGVNKKCKIIGFEPNAKLYSKLLEKYKNNDNIRLFNLGVSSVNGTLTFKENLLDLTSSFEELDYDSDYLKRKARILGVSSEQLILDEYDVDVIDLYSFIKKNVNQPIDLIKIDVEGHEYECLLGLFKNNDLPYPIRFIQLESHNDDMYKNKRSPNEITKLLFENGYHEIKKIKHGFGDFCELIFEKQ